MGAINKVGVIGGGAWGTALALTAARAGRDVVLWARDPGTVSDIRARRQNTRYLPGITFDEELNATDKLDEVVGTDAILLVTPAQTTRAMLSAIKDAGEVRGPIVLCAKGIEQSTGKLLSTVMSEELPGVDPGVLSGPSFADDVARGLPTAVTVAANSNDLAHNLCKALQSPCFRPYASTDVLGTQIGGALKNVLAIACGAVVGRKLGASAQAALTARGFAELTRVGTAMGAQGETLTGLSGLGDLVLTCSSSQSRNFSFGVRLGEGFMASELIAAGGKLAEGAYSARVAVKLAERYGIELPICATVAKMIDDNLSIDDALNTLMARPLKSETESV
ncbi:MAG: NAD(P)-dependent glycerol-3-phosphate dehydrogenase [Roseibium sp.]|uniref:NAD(P)H-dependent glycerol-3-phosphate dehydrogenase n=1 Tax=Roseibium sp. TaxID=1936156 RepID=UPI002615C704|nr:NAD(P)H-dependent glycerol-3-phosphate dehydrogenase [Roseibium sp.]MCV0426144.1 NAD(P)-dependent glycerol-3-phosphate dehydrogenase [Roseibium sp.]